MLIQYDRYLVAATTIWSGASYVYTKDAVKILSQQEVEEKMAEKKEKEEEKKGDEGK